MWTAADIEIELVGELSAGEVVTVRLSTPAGDLIVMAEIEAYDRELVLAGVHIQTETLWPNSLGCVRLRQLARAAAEKVDVDVIIIQGAARTTGAHHGRIPSRLRFPREVRASC